MSLSLREAFDEVADLSVEQRFTLYRRHAMSEAEIAELERLVAATHEPDGTDEPLPDLERVLLRTPLAGSRLGRWRLVEPLGRGGMGVVWRATREDGRVEQTVAIKLLDQPLDPSLHARIALERNILARLDHPGIGRFIDAGEDADGHPYFAMELIAGKAIDQWANENRCTVRARVQSVVGLLEALAHAHAQLVVHRDLKCSNVLVPASGAPKLIDFGIARNLDNQSDTRAYGRFLTLRNAAPEQLLGQTVGTGVDIYGAGLVLYELLCGLHPFAGDYSRSGELEQRILDESPLPPSRTLQRVLRTDPARAREIAAQRGLSSAAALCSALNGDLDAIVGKALSKASGERYQTAEAFAADLSRWIEGRPVKVRRVSAWYRLRKFVGRHRLAVAAGASVVIGLLGFSIALWQARSAAGEARDTAEQTVDFLVDVFAAGNPEQNFGKPPTAVELLDRAAANLPVAGPPTRTQAAFSLAIAQTLLGLGEPRRALDLLDPQLAQLLDAPMHDSLLLTRIQATVDAGQPARALEMWQGASPQFSTRSGERLHLQAGQLHVRILLALDRRQDADNAARQLQAELGVVNALSEGWRLRMLADVTWILSGRSGGGPADYRIMEAVLEQQRQRQGDRHPDVAESLRRLAQLDRFAGDFAGARKRLAEAQQIISAVYGKDHLQTGRLINSLANLEADSGHPLAALDAYRQALAIFEARLDASHQIVAMVKLNVAMLTHMHRNDPAGALRLLEQVRDSARLHWPDDGANYGVLLLAMAAAQTDVGQLTAAEANIETALNAAQLAQRSDAIAWGRAELAQLRAARGEPEAAASLLGQALPVMTLRPQFFGAYLERAQALSARLPSAAPSSAVRQP